MRAQQAWTLILTDLFQMALQNLDVEAVRRDVAGNNGSSDIVFDVHPRGEK